MAGEVRFVVFRSLGVLLRPKPAIYKSSSSLRLSRGRTVTNPPGFDKSPRPRGLLCLFASLLPLPHDWAYYYRLNILQDPSSSPIYRRPVLVLPAAFCVD